MIREYLRVAFTDMSNIDAEKQTLKAAGLASLDLPDQLGRRFFGPTFEICYIFDRKLIDVGDIFHGSRINKRLNQNIAQPLYVHRFSRCKVLNAGLYFCGTVRI